MQGIYFWFSFGFLIVRSLAVCLSGSEVYQQSRVIINVINYVPTKFYYREVNKLNFSFEILLLIYLRREFFQVEFLQKYAQSETVAVSSYGIFDIKKPTILQVRQQPTSHFNDDAIFFILQFS